MKKLLIISEVLLGVLISIFFMPSVARAQTDSIVRVGACKVNYCAWSLVVKDSFVYLVDYGSFAVIDISDPTSPWVRGTFRHTNTTVSIFVKDTLAYIRSNVFLDIINVANPDSLVTVGYTAGLPLWSHIYPRGLYVSDTIAFVANSNNGLSVCNVKDPTAPCFLYYDTLLFHPYTIDLTMRDSVLFVADWDDFLIVNAKDPLNLSLISAVPIPETDCDVFVIDNYAYVTCLSTCGTDGKLKIVDISDLHNPQIVGEVTNIRGDPVAVHIENDYAYIAAYDKGSYNVEGGIRVGYAHLDSTSLATSYDTPGTPSDVYVVGDLVFVADYDSLQILRHIGAGAEEKESKDKRLEIRVWPNPFKEQANIMFSISYPTNGRIEIYDKTGRKVRTLYDGLLFPGRYRFYWNGRDKFGKEVVSREYFITLTIGNALRETKKVIYLK